MQKKNYLLRIFFSFFLLIPLMSFADVITGQQDDLLSDKKIRGVPEPVLQDSEIKGNIKETDLSQPIINPDNQPETSHWYKGKFREFKDQSYEILSFLKGRIAIGTRSEYFKLKTEKDDFIGSINYLKADQDYNPNRVFLDVTFADYLGIKFDFELTWTKLEMGTITTYGNDQNDGNLQLQGPVFIINGHYQNSSRFTPYAGIGAVYFNNTDVSEGWWHYGFTPPEGGDWRDAENEYQAWRRSGSPAWPNGGFTRTFKLDKTWGYILNAGCTINIYKSWNADINIRYTDAVVDNTYYLSFYGHPVDIRYSEFDVSNYTIGIGIKYQV